MCFEKKKYLMYQSNCIFLLSFFLHTETLGFLIFFNVFGIGTLLRPIIDPDNTVDENSACCNGLDQAALYISSDPNNTIVLGMDGGIYNPTPEELAGNFVIFEPTEF